MRDYQASVDRGVQADSLAMTFHCEPIQSVSQYGADPRARGDGARQVAFVQRVVTGAFAHGSFLASLETLARAFQLVCGVAVSTDFEQVELDERAQRIAYALVKECLANIGKHAGATRAYVDILDWKSSTVITVRDDGVGCEKARMSGSCRGLAAMRRQVRACGGELCYFSAPGKGTQVVAVLPPRRKNEI